MNSAAISVTPDLSVALVPVTEAAAIAAFAHVGRGDKLTADGAAVEAMRTVLAGTGIDGIVVVGEGEKDEAPMLYVGERVGTGQGPAVDIAVDPIDGTTLTANGMPNAVAVLAIAPRGTMADLSAAYYMDKLVAGAAVADVVDITAPVDVNLKNMAAATGRAVEDLTVCVLARPRHQELIAAVHAAGARTRLITDGDVAGGILAATPGSGVDLLLGVGGAPEAVITACAVVCLGGVIQARLAPQSDSERERVLAAGLDLDRVYAAGDLVTSPDVAFVATGITDGDLVTGVQKSAGGVGTQSLALSPAAARTITTTHR